MHQKVFILGASGSVGSTLLAQVVKHDIDSSNRNPTSIIGIANSTWMWLPKTGIPESFFHQIQDIKAETPQELIEKRKRLVSQLIEQEGEEISMTDTILSELKKMGYQSEAIIVDATASNMDSFHKSAISNNYNFGLVTANKKPVSMTPQSVFDELTANHGIYDFNTTVMAGGGAVNALRRAVNTRDAVRSLEGCFSGTLGYIASELEKWEKTFSQIVSEAKAAGYTEPNPWDDLNGLDVARKLVILIRSAGYKIEWNDIETKVEPFIPKQYGAIQDPVLFLKSIEAEDSKIADKYAEAKAQWKTYKYVASVQFDGTTFGDISVGLKLVDKESKIGSLSGTSNIILIHSDIYDITPHVIDTPGAGLELTANSIRNSIANFLPKNSSR